LNRQILLSQANAKHYKEEKIVQIRALYHRTPHHQNKLNKKKTLVS